MSLQSHRHQPGFQYGHQERAGQRSGHRPDAAGHRRSADNNRRNRVHFQPVPGSRDDRRIGRGVDDRRKAAEEAADSIDGDFPKRNVDAGSLMSGMSERDIAAS